LDGDSGIRKIAGDSMRCNENFVGFMQGDVYRLSCEKIAEVKKQRKCREGNGNMQKKKKW
jgi:hypothetical protein